jgi:hypothetical protein
MTSRKNPKIFRKNKQGGMRSFGQKNKNYHQRTLMTSRKTNTV